MAFTSNLSARFVASCFAFFLVTAIPRVSAQKSAEAPMYRNPILFADYSDPDVIRVGSDYYLVASTFHFAPGIPILHS
jgi:beta-xylosidase